MASPTRFRRTRTHAPTTAVPARSARKRRGRTIAAGLGAATIGTAGCLACVLGPSGSATAAWATATALPTGAGLVLNKPVVGVAATATERGYWIDTADGGVFSFGDAQYYGSTGSLILNKPVVGMSATPSGRGYWEVASDGGVFAFGDAGFHGSTGGLPLAQPIVGLAPTPSGGGYWEVASDGGVFAFGNAGFYGSAAGLSPDSPIVGLAATGDGRGYWETAANGHVFAFGDARYAGNAAAGTPIVGINSSGTGYRLIAADGGVFAFGGASYLGSTGGHPLTRPMIASTATGGGYLELGADGGVFAFGSVAYEGSLAGSTVYVPPPPPPPPPPPAPAVVAPLVTPLQMALWSRVNMCEEGGNWHVDGAKFSGGLGFTHQNWTQFNTFGFPADAAYATPEQQVRVAVAFATYYYGNPNWAPDANGCAGY